MQTLDWILDSLNFLEFFQLLSRLGYINTGESSTMSTAQLSMNRQLR